MGVYLPKCRTSRQIRKVSCIDASVLFAANQLDEFSYPARD